MHSISIHALQQHKHDINQSGLAPTYDVVSSRTNQYYEIMQSWW